MQIRQQAMHAPQPQEAQMKEARMKEREELELRIRTLCTEGESNRAAELALEVYGTDILKFILSVLREPEQANDVFAIFRENLLRGLPRFRWESSLRTWAYRVARNACYEALRSPVSREEPVSQVKLPDEAQRERTQTHPWQRTEVKDRFRALREQLTLEERTLLQLRVDQELSWVEVARVLAGDDEDLSRSELERRAMALRQQYHRLKERLRALAQQEGLIPSGEQPEA